MKNILILFIALNLFGCGKSEIDKCVDAKIISYLFELCEKGEVKCEESEKIDIKVRIQKVKEGEYREQCLKAAGK
jgi:hypothetical protein